MEHSFIVDLLPEIHLSDNEFLVFFQLLSEVFRDMFQHQVKHRFAVLEVGDALKILPGLGQETQLLLIGQKGLGEINPERIRGVYAFDGLQVNAKDPCILEF